jgi:hypothetical protein
MEAGQGSPTAPISDWLTDQGDYGRRSYIGAALEGAKRLLEDCGDEDLTIVDQALGKIDIIRKGARKKEIAAQFLRHHD